MIGTKERKIGNDTLTNKASLTFLEWHKKTMEKNEKDSRKFNDNKTSLQSKRVCEDLERTAIDKKIWKDS